MGNPGLIVDRDPFYIFKAQEQHIIMDAIRKKMKSLKDETDQLYAIIQKFEDETKEANSVLEQAECDIRDYGKKVHGFEIEFDETLDKLNKANETYEEKDKMHKEVEADIAALSRRIMLMEEESKKAEVNLANTVTKLALSSKQLELSAEKAVEREEKLKEKILSIQNKYKVAEGRFEYGEMNITKLNQRIDDIEDEIYREKLKIKEVADELGDTFDDMLAHY